MTITQVKEINEKIIELTDYIRRYRLETVNVSFRNWFYTSGQIRLRIINMERIDHDLGYAYNEFMNAYYYMIRYTELKPADDAIKTAVKCVYCAYANRYEVGDDISLEEIALWIDLFALIY